ncbi:MAG: hypothetical protein ACXABY_11220 [Candidatus Thorarchaeota archaeon]
MTPKQTIERIEESREAIQQAMTDLLVELEEHELETEMNPAAVDFPVDVGDLSVGGLPNMGRKCSPTSIAGIVDDLCDHAGCSPQEIAEKLCDVYHLWYTDGL